MCGGRCWGCEEALGEVWGSVGRSMEKCGGRCGEVLWGVGKYWGRSAVFSQNLTTTNFSKKMFFGVFELKFDVLFCVQKSKC